MKTRRCYVVADLLVALQLSRSSFFALRKAGRIPMLEELRPRIGCLVRFRADLVDRYLAGQWGQPRAFRAHVLHGRRKVLKGGV